MKRRAANFLQKYLNKFLHLDPESKGRLRKLDNKIVTLELLGINLPVQLIFKGEKVELKTSDFLKPDTIIKGTPLTLLHMTLTPDRKQFFADDVSIEGNLELGQDVIDLFDDLEIDFEETISHIVGDMPAHQLGRVVTHFKDFSQRVRKTLLLNINEYFHEEINLVPPTEALNDFFHEVDELRLDVDRIEARVRKLSSKVNPV